MTRWVLPAAFCVWVSSVAVAPAQQQALTPPADLAAVERGQAVMTAQCGFCHGSNARGGASGGPDLTRSEIVQLDEGGRQLGEFLRVGRPERNMPRFELPDAQLADLAAFLHAQIYYASNRRLYKILDVLVGDPKAGEAFFNGAGGCHKCHTTTGASGSAPGGDLKGVASKYADPAVLQNRMLLPRNARPGTPPTPAHRLPNALRASVTLPSGESASGTLVRLTDFEVTLFDPKTEQMRSWLRNGDVPTVVVTDRLQAHMDMLTQWTDATMHDVTAYLATLK